MSVRSASFRERAAAYVPLWLHLLPTLAIGFGVVIPRSCIAGWNELTIGFVGANLGFALSYCAGVRLARRERRDA
jgi:hypothetical protein